MATVSLAATAMAQTDPGEVARLPAKPGQPRIDTDAIRSLLIPSVPRPASADGLYRIDMEIGQLDPRLNLAPCQKIDPFLPPNARLWGSTRVGLQCLQGPVAWKVYLPITVKVWAQAVVTSRALPTQTVLSADDMRLAEVDWAAAAGTVFTQPQALIGRTTATALQAGSPLRETQLKVRQWFAAGDTVRIIVRGPGYLVTQEGTAMTPGREGQVAHIRVENGRVISAHPVGEKTAERAP